MFKVGCNKNKHQNRIYSRFITFVLSALLILMLLIVRGTYKQLSENKDNFGSVDIIFLFVSVTSLLIIYLLRKKIIPTKIFVGIVFGIGLLIRICYSLSIKSIPISDFAIMYETADNVLSGDFSKFWGIGYIARFPHITIPTMYFACIKAIFPEPLIMIKIFNALASSSNIIIMYLLIKELFNDKFKALVACILTVYFPPLILYTAVYTTENIAIPLYLFGIYLFILYCNGKKGIKILFLSASIISIANMFRMVGQIIIVAMLLYLLICYNEKAKKKFISIIIVVVGFIVPLMGTSFALHYGGIIEYQLWRGSEPSATNIVKGLNIEYEGRWNPEDAAIPEIYNFDYAKIEEACNEIICERLSTTPKGVLFDFFKHKFISQWSQGDFAGSYWAEHSLEDKSIGLKVSENGIWFSQGYLFVILSLSYIGLFNIKTIKENRCITLFYFIFCGYGILYLISENQARYGFVVSWVFIIMAITGIDLLQKIKEGVKDGGI